LHKAETTVFLPILCCVLLFTHTLLCPIDTGYKSGNPRSYEAVAQTPAIDAASYLTIMPRERDRESERAY